MSKEKLSICFIGHVDSGKSTTVGNLAFQLGAVDQRKMDKLKKEAELKGKQSFHYAFVTDKNEAERDRGITITTTLIKIETNRYNLNVIDCPGHKDFIKNMVTGTAQADVGVVIVPSAEGEFESAISGGTLRDHIMISGVLGVKSLIVCVNKLDTIAPDMQEKRFNEVRNEMFNIINTIHPDKNPIILPISGIMGINIVEKGEKFGWYKGWKKTPEQEVPVTSLEGALDFQTVPPRNNDKPLRVPLNDSLKVPGIGTVLTGQVIAGKLTPGMQVVVQPSQVYGEIKSLEIHKQAVPEVLSGENCGFVLKVTKGDTAHIKSGHVLSDIKNNPVKLANGAQANIIIVEHPKGVKKGYCPVMDLGTSHVPVKLAKLISKKMKGIAEAVTDPAIVEKGETVTAIIMPQKPCVMEGIKENAQLGRLALRDGGKIVGIGAIVKTMTDEQLKAEGCIEEKTAVAPGKPAAGKRARG
ncbi:Elongation factor 1-alpha 1 [Binucleata daphniae]